MLPICVRTERVWPKLPSIQGIRANLVYIVSLKFAVMKFAEFARTPCICLLVGIHWNKKVSFKELFDYAKITFVKILVSEMQLK